MSLNTGTVTANPGTPFRIFGRDPILILELVKQVLAFAALFWLGLSDDMQIAIMVLIQAIFTALQALSARPIVPTVFSGVISAAATLLLYAGVELDQDAVFTFQALVAGVLTLALTNRTTPIVDPRGDAVVITDDNPPADDPVGGAVGDDPVIVEGPGEGGYTQMNVIMGAVLVIAAIIVVWFIVKIADDPGKTDLIHSLLVR